MLVLTRRAKQQIRLGDDIIVTVLQVKGNAIRLGIEAPRETRIIRGELEFFEDEPPKSLDTNGKQKSSRNVPTSPLKKTVANPTPSKSVAGKAIVSGPTRLKIRSDSTASSCFPSVMKLASENAAEARPLKSFMPKSVIEAIGDVSV